MEVWARGNNVWRQLEFSPSSDEAGEAELSKAGSEEGRNEGEEEEREPRDLDGYEKVFEAERVEWVRSDGFGSIGKFRRVSFVFGVLGGRLLICPCLLELALVCAVFEAISNFTNCS